MKLTPAQRALRRDLIMAETERGVPIMEAITKVCAQFSEMAPAPGGQAELIERAVRAGVAAALAARRLPAAPLAGMSADGLGQAGLAGLGESARSPFWQAAATGRTTPAVTETAAPAELHRLDLDGLSQATRAYVMACAADGGFASPGWAA